MDTFEYVRLGGDDRYQTSGAVATWAADNGLGWSKPGVATGISAPDVLAGSAFCGANSSVLLLADDSDDSNVKLLRENKAKIRKVYVLGGESAVGPAVYSAIVNAVD